MNRKRARWGIVLLVTLLSGCATGANERLVTQAKSPARGSDGRLSALRRRDPMHAQKAQAARVSPDSAPGAPDERLVRFFPGMGQPSVPPVASRPLGRGTPAPSPTGSRVPPSPGATRGSAPADSDESLSTLPVAVTVGLRRASGTRPSTSPSTPAPRLADVWPTPAQGRVDAAVVPASADVTEDAANAPSLLPRDLSFGPVDDVSALDAKVPGQTSARSAKAESPAAAAAPKPEPRASTPEPTAAPPSKPQANEPSSAPAIAPAPEDAPRYVEPMLVVSDPPHASEPVDSAVAAIPAPEIVPAPAPALPAPGNEPTLQPPSSAPKAESTRAATATEPAKPASPARRAPAPAIAAADGLRQAPLPATTLPVFLGGAPAPAASAAPAGAPTPTMAVVPQAQAGVPAMPPLPSKQMPRLSPQTLCAQESPSPRPRLLLGSFWPLWQRGDAAATAAPTPRPVFAFGRSFASSPAATATASTAPPAPRAFFASLWPSWLRADAPTAAQSAPPAAPTVPATPTATSSTTPRVAHAHGCPHHVCQQGGTVPWFGVNRTAETAALFPPTYYETARLRAGRMLDAPPAPPALATADHPPAAAPATSAPVVAEATAPTGAQQPRPKRVPLITRLWNRIHGTGEVAQSTVPPAPPTALPAASGVATAAAPGAVRPSGDAVPGDLAQGGEPVERVSAERVNESAHR